MAVTADFRLHGFDWLRCWAIAAVVGIHTSDWAFRKNGYFPAMTLEADGYYLLGAWLHFCVPTFFMMSAFLLERRLLSRGAQPAARWKRYLFPLIVASILYTVVTVAGARAMHKPIMPVHLLMMALAGRAFIHTWFLLSVLVYSLAHGVLRRLASPWAFSGLVIFYTVLFAVTRGRISVLDPSGAFAGAFADVLMGLPYYVGGIWMAQHQQRILDLHKASVLGLMLLGVAGSAAYGLIRERGFYNPGTELLSVAAFIWALRVRTPPPRGVALLAAFSLGIYLWHPLILVAARLLEGRHLSTEAISPAVTFGIMLAEIAAALIGGLVIALTLARSPRLRRYAQ